MAESWSTVAQQYEKRLAPHFQPWLDQLVGALDAEQLPKGPVIVPACGPGDSIEQWRFQILSTLSCIRNSTFSAGIELLMLARAIPGERQVIGIDLAQGMVDVAYARIDASPDPLLRWANIISTAAHASSTSPSLCSQLSVVVIASDLHSVIVAPEEYIIGMQAAGDGMCWRCMQVGCIWPGPRPGLFLLRPAADA